MAVQFIAVVAAPVTSIFTASFVLSAVTLTAHPDARASATDESVATDPTSAVVPAVFFIAANRRHDAASPVLLRPDTSKSKAYIAFAGTDRRLDALGAAPSSVNSVVVASLVDRDHAAITTGGTTVGRPEVRPTMLTCGKTVSTGEA